MHRRKATIGKAYIIGSSACSKTDASNNPAEIELSALVRQCLHRHIPDLRTLDAESQAWAKERSEKVVKIDWRFTTADSRIKLKHLYPKI